jgi:prepilin-type N-terminal cleavage/methylation domain-containing protein
MKLKTNKSNGFTVVELMIATAIFSVIMLIGLYTFIRIGRYYTRAISIIRTQDATRNIEMDIANQLQLTSGSYSTTTSGSSMVKCIGNKAYVYQVNIAEDGTGRALSSYEIAPSSCPINFDASTKRVILRNGTRLLQLDVTPSPNASGPIFAITVSLLYEPDQTTQPALVDTSAGATNYGSWKCKTGISGSEYCALSSITTTVYKRVQ